MKDPTTKQRGPLRADIAGEREVQGKELANLDLDSAHADVQAFYYYEQYGWIHKK